MKSSDGKDTATALASLLVVLYIRRDDHFDEQHNVDVCPRQPEKGESKT